MQLADQFNTALSKLIDVTANVGQLAAGAVRQGSDIGALRNWPTAHPCGAPVIPSRQTLRMAHLPGTILVQALDDPVIISLLTLIVYENFVWEDWKNLGRIFLRKFLF